MKTHPAAEPVTRRAIHRERGAGHELTVIEREGLVELHLTLQPFNYENPVQMIERMERILGAHGAKVVRHEIFGPNRFHADVVAALHRFPGLACGPVHWLAGAPCDSHAIAGMHVFAIAGAHLDPVVLDGRLIGCAFRDGFALHCLLSDVVPPDPTAARDVQGRDAFENLAAGLDRVGMNFTQVARTWLYMEDILGWYGQLNKVRREFFEGCHMFEHVVPASTGIGAGNPSGAAISTGAWAAQPTDPRFGIHEVLSPMQCPAPQYGSCFSRAVEMVWPGWRRLFISGTASIEPKGASVCAGDIDGQIDLTMQVVRAMLVSRDMDYSDVTRATAYLRRAGDVLEWNRWRKRLGLEHWPCVITEAVVCRDELLFEIELDAIAPLPARPGEWEI